MKKMFRYTYVLKNHNTYIKPTTEYFFSTKYELCHLTACEIIVAIL